LAAVVLNPKREDPLLTSLLAQFHPIQNERVQFLYKYKGPMPVEIQTCILGN
jgi:hypothetical protein